MKKISENDATVGLELVALGIAASHAARLLNIPMSTLNYVITVRGGVAELFPDRPNSRDIVAVRRAVEVRRTALRETARDEVGDRVLRCLEAWLAMPPFVPGRGELGVAERRAHIKAMYSAGIKFYEIASCLACSQPRVVQELRALAIDRASRATVSFPAVLALYAKGRCLRQFPEGVQRTDVFLANLYRLLNLRAVKMYERELWLLQRRLERPSCTSEELPYVRLLHLLEVGREGNEEGRPKSALRPLLMSIAAGGRAAPNTLEALMRELELSFDRSRIRGAWSSEGTSLLERMLDDLTPGQAEKIRLYVGIGRAGRLTMAQVAEQLEVSRQGVSATIASGLRNLREHPFMVELARAFGPVADLQQEPLVRIRQLLAPPPEPVVEEIPTFQPLSTEQELNLVREWSEFDLSTRTRKRFNKRGWRYVWQVAVRPDLEGIAGFAEKCKCEVLALLESLGLSVNMRIDTSTMPQP